MDIINIKLVVRNAVHFAAILLIIVLFLVFLDMSIVFADKKSPSDFIDTGGIKLPSIPDTSTSAVDSISKDQQSETSQDVKELLNTVSKKVTNQNDDEDDTKLLDPENTETDIKSEATDKKLPITPITDEKNSDKQSDATVNIQNSTSKALEPDKDKKKFVRNEAQILILPNDDVVLGVLQNNVHLENINFSEYEKLFWRNYYKHVDLPKTIAINKFIDDYYLYQNPSFITDGSYDHKALYQAFKAIKTHDFYTLSTILDSYQIVYDRDKNNNSLLHAAARSGNYPAAKLLLMKGVYLDAFNNNYLTPSMLAHKYNHNYILYLFMKAGSITATK